jgi:hypothetical protein
MQLRYWSCGAFRMPHKEYSYVTRYVVHLGCQIKMQLRYWLCGAVRLLNKECSYVTGYVVELGYLIKNAVTLRVMWCS